MGTRSVSGTVGTRGPLRWEQLLIAASSLLILAGVIFRVLHAYRQSAEFGLYGNRYTPLVPIAENLLDGWFFSADGVHPNVTEEPVFPIVIALSYALPGASWFSYVVVQTAIAGVGAWAVFRFCALYSSPRSQALLASALFFSHPYLASQCVSIADTQLLASVLALIGVSWAWLESRNSAASAIVAGLCLGVGLLTRNTTLVLVPALAVFIGAALWREGWRARAARLRNVAVAVTVTLLVVAPWGVRNLYHTGSFLIATHGKRQVAYGNNPLIREILEHDVAIELICWEIDERVERAAARRWTRGSAQFQLEAANIAQREGIQWALSHLGEFAALIPLRLQKTWTWNMFPRYGLGRKEYPSYALKAFVLKSYLLPTTVLAALSFCMPRLWNRGTLLCAAIVFFFSCAAAAIFGTTRLRVPFDTFLIIPAAASFSWLVGQLRGRLG